MKYKNQFIFHMSIKYYIFRWNFVIEDFESPSFASNGVPNVDINIASLTTSTCCGLVDMPNEKDVEKCLSKCSTKPKNIIVAKAAQVIGKAAQV